MTTDIVGKKLCLTDGALCTIERVTRHDISLPDGPDATSWVIVCRIDDDPDVIHTCFLHDITAGDGRILLDPTPEEVREHRRTAPLRLREQRERDRLDDNIPF